MNKTEYKQYENKVADFFNKEGINNLTGTSDENGNVEPYFSWHRCDCCGSSLGGDRYDCNGYNPTTKETQSEYTVCSDCVYYAEYGRLDDMTMDIEEEAK